MKLSTAILKGCKKAPKKACEVYIRFDNNSRLKSACALGAAYIGATNVTTSMINQCDLEKLFPVLTDFYDTIVTLNDNYHWSRERIAKWLSKKGY